MPATVPSEPTLARARGTLYRRASFAIASAATAFYAVFMARTAFSVGGRTYFSLFDDAMISMRYARNLAHGAGLVWNAGQHPVEGYTNSLWTVWMAVLHLTGVSDAKASLLVMLSGAAILVANLFVVRAIVETLAPGKRGAALVAMAATAAYYPLVYWTLRGMEVGLISLLCSAMVLYALRLERAFDRRTLVKLVLIMVAGVLTRDDVVVPCAVVLAFVLIRSSGQRRVVAAMLGGAVAVAIGAHEVFRLLYYGSALPNTYALKVGGIGLGVRVSRGANVLGAVTVHALVAPLALAAAGLAVRVRRVPAGMWLLAGLFFADAAYSVYVGGDAWEFFGTTNRFLTPVVPLLLALAAVSFARLRELGARRAVTVLALGLAGVALVHLAASRGWSLIPSLPYVAGGGATPGPELARAIGSLLVAGALSVALSRSRSVRLLWPLLAVALIVATAGDQLDQWRWSGAAYTRNDARAARLGVHLRETTSPGTSIAVVWAGATPYFDHRPSIDLLGKSDTVIAHEPPHHRPLLPGHMKWDYAYSVGKLHPDVITELWRPTAADLALVRRAGYVQRSDGIYVRRGSSSLSRGRRERAGI